MNEPRQNEIVDAILDKVDIVEVISSRLLLKKTGRNYKANCPFHSEKTPSFVVSQEKQIFHCFGCQTGGNAITFLMKHDKLTFREALRILADKANVKLPALRFQEDAVNDAFEKLYALNEKAKNFYASLFTTEDGKFAYKYLKDRGLNDETIKLFGLGYAPNSWDGLIAHLAKDGVNNETMEKAGLILRRENNDGYYDRFRNRVIFPIFEIRGKVIGFGARALGDIQPKYINSPETPIYNKGKNLYGLNLTKSYITEKKYAIIVEGYLDLVVPYQYGIRNVVATLGTALTTDQVKLLKRFTNTVVIVYDPDQAGKEASLRGLDLLVANEVNVRIATLPEGYDPDTYVREKGQDGFTGIIKASKDLFDYKMDLLTAKYNKDGVRGKAAIATLMLPTIARIPNEILKASFLKKLSEKLGIDESALRSETKKVKLDYSYNVSIPESHENKPKAHRNAEVLLLGIVIDDPDTLSFISNKIEMSSLRDETVREVLDAVMGMINDGKNISGGKLVAHFNNEEARLVTAKAIGMLDTIMDKEKALADCIKKIIEENFKDDRNSLREEIRVAEEEKNTPKVNDLLARYNELLKTHKG